MRGRGSVGRRIVDAGELCAGLCAAIALFGIMMLMVFDVIGRYLFNRPVPGAAEVIELAMGIVVFAALPLVTARGEHVTLDYFEKLFTGRAGQLVRALVDLVTTGILAFLAWRMAIKAMTHVRYSDTSAYLGIPVAPVALFMAGATAVAALVLLTLSLRTLFLKPETKDRR